MRRKTHPRQNAQKQEIFVGFAKEFVKAEILSENPPRMIGYFPAGVPT